jgi:uncharacterized damage-inducible protein DinB
MSDLTPDFIRQNEWANLRLIEACRTLTDEQLDATAAGVYGSIRSTLGHIISSELWYPSHLGQDVELWDDETDEWPGWDALADMVRRGANALASAAESADHRVRSASGKYDIEAPVIIVQMVHHGTEHRSQINTVLTSLGVEPVDLSSWAWGDATGRIHEV